MNARILLACIVALLTLLRWTWNAPHEMSPEEAYLALCGRSPAPAYFEGPPGTALCVALGVAVAGPSDLGAALAWPVFAALATLALYLLVAPLRGSRAALALAVLLNLLPAFNLATLAPGAAMPVTMFALAFMACAWRALDRGAPGWWLLAGFCAAGALLFAYGSWFLVPSLALVLLASHRWRRHLVASAFWLAALPPLAVLAALFLWNARHGWVHFIGGTWQTALAIHWSHILPGLASAAFAVSPLVLVAVAAGFVSCLRDIRVAPKAKFLAVPALAALAVAGYAVLTGCPSVVAGLAASALALPLLAWLPAGISPHQHRARNWQDRSAQLLRDTPASPLFLPAVFLTAAFASFAAIARTAPPANPVSGAVVLEVEALRAAQSAEQPVFLIAENAALAAALSLHLRDTASVAAGHPPVYVVESPFADSQYALWPRYDQFLDAPPASPQDDNEDPFTEQDGANPFLGRSALYITWQAVDDLPQAVTAAFAAHRLLAEITTPSGAVLRVFLCEDYQTLPL